jgi:putative FmdB family regulatory protein
MPIYGYRCENGHLFEVMQRMSEDPLTACETCSAPVQRVFHPVAVHFKGSGFYNTDYGKGRRNREADAAGTTASSDGGSDTGSSDSKPAESAQKGSGSASGAGSGSGSSTASD